MHTHVLQLDIQGTPQAWISLEDAALDYATDSVAWEGGDGPLALLRGGWNAAAGRCSQLEVYPIIALRGAPRISLYAVEPGLTKGRLCRRDRFTCAYCGRHFTERELQCEHIVPQSHGGRGTWMNLVAACGPCNLAKADRTPEQAGMPLLFLPYVPSRFETFLLEGRSIRADVHEWLAARLPRHSRLPKLGRLQ